MHQFHSFDHTAETHTHVSTPGRNQGKHAVTPVLAPNAVAHGEFRFFPRTATDDFLDAYCASAQRDDSARCTALFEKHMQMPHMQAVRQQGSDLYKAERQRQLAEQKSLEQEGQETFQE